MTELSAKNPMEFSVSKQSVEGFVSQTTQKASALKQRIAKKVDSVPFLKKASDKIKSFDSKMTEKYGRTYKTARNIALGVGMAAVAAQAGTAGLTALCAINAARSLAPLMNNAEKAKSEGKASGIIDYISKNKGEATMALAGASVSGIAAVAGIAGSEWMVGASRASGAALAATANVSAVGQSAIKAVKGQASWKDVGDNVAAAAITAATYYAFSGSSNESAQAQQTSEPVAITPEPVVEPVVIAPEPVVEPVVVAPEPVIEPIAQPTVTPEPVVQPAITPEPTVTPIEPLEPIAAPEPIIPVIEPELPKIDIPAPKDPLFNPETYDDNYSVYVERTIIEGDRTFSIGETRSVDNGDTSTFYMETKSLEGGTLIQDANGPDSTISYRTPEGQEIDMTKDFTKAQKGMDANHDGRVDEQEYAKYEEKLQTRLTKKYGENTANNVMEASNYFEKDTSVSTESMLIEKSSPELELKRVADMRRGR